MGKVLDVIVIGGGQSALAVAYYLRRSGLSYLLLDKESKAGGSWQHAWESLSLFSPALWSSLPGVIAPGGTTYYPGRDETITYLREYEKRYGFPVERPVTVTAVHQQNNTFVLETSNGNYEAKAVVSATGSFTNPVVPTIEGREKFSGTVIHSSEYRSPAAFAGMRVAVVGEGNSGAQILAELSRSTDTLWVTLQQPSFLPDEVDGKFLFDAATQQYEARKQGKDYKLPSLGQIVMVPAVKEARQRNVLHAIPAFDHFYESGIGWNDGRREAVDAVIFCTGFKPALSHLQPALPLQANGRVETKGTRAVAVPGLWLVGYGNWTGFASATLIGVGRSAKKTVDEIGGYLQAL